MISVIIPANNETVSLWFTLHALRIEFDRDSAEPCEIIVVDHTSAERTQKFLDDDMMKPWVRRMETDVRCPGLARTLGAREAKGDILLFLDAHVLLSPGFLTRLSGTMRNEVWDRVGSLHFPVGSNGFSRGEYATHCQLTLEHDFSGVNRSGAFTALTEIAVHSHCCVAMRKDRFFETGCYVGLEGNYGGEDAYLDLKFAMFGLQNFCDPRAFCLRCPQLPMSFDSDPGGRLRSRMIFAYALGGEAWLERVFQNRKQAGDLPEPDLLAARTAACVAGQADRKSNEKNAKRTLDEVLADFRLRHIPH